MEALDELAINIIFAFLRFDLISKLLQVTTESLAEIDHFLNIFLSQLMRVSGNHTVVF